MEATAAVDEPHQADALRRMRLRWRARRGLLENDIVLTRFLDRHEATLDDDGVGALTALLELSDNALLDLILARAQPEAELDRPDVVRLVEMLRDA